MKVAFNKPSESTGHQFRGIGVYATSILEELKKLPGIEIIEFSDPRQIPPADIVHYPYFDLFHPTLPQRKPIPTIVTIHDVIPLIFPQHYPPGLKGRLNFSRQKFSLKTVKAVVTNSNCSKNDISQYLSVPESKIYVTYLGISKDFKPIKDQKFLKRVFDKYNLLSRFGLYVGNVNWNKNILGIAKACIEADVDLYLVGKSFDQKNDLNHPELKSFKNFLEKYSKHPKIHILGFIPHEDLIPLINLSSVMLFPSFYEGFGFPILEAQACGVPVITSNVASMPEVGGVGAIYVNPYDGQEIKAALIKLLNNPDLRSELINKGIQNLDRFSWEKTAQETVKVYAKVLEH